MVENIGIDIVEIKRFKKNLNEIAQKILVGEEKIYYDNIENKSRKLEFVASRWAAKEAIIKSLNLYLLMNKIEIIQNQNNKLIVKVNNIIVKDLLISISHEKKYVVCMAINSSKI